MTLIEISYTLYRKHGDRYEPVVAADDMRLQDAIRAVDTHRRVTHVPDARQGQVLHDHLLQLPWSFPIEGHSIDLSSYEPSYWDAVVRRWIVLLAGASNVYRVYRSMPSDAQLYLVVATKDARGQIGAVDQEA